MFARTPTPTELSSVSGATSETKRKRGGGRKGKGKKIKSEDDELINATSLSEAELAATYGITDFGDLPVTGGIKKGQYKIQGTALICFLSTDIKLKLENFKSDNITAVFYDVRSRAGNKVISMTEHQFLMLCRNNYGFTLAIQVIRTRPSYGKRLDLAEDFKIEVRHPYICMNLTKFITSNS